MAEREGATLSKDAAERLRKADAAKAPHIEQCRGKIAGMVRDTALGSNAARYAWQTLTWAVGLAQTYCAGTEYEAMCNAHLAEGHKVV